MSVSIVTFADLGTKTNLKTVGIMPIIDAFKRHQVPLEIICRLNTGFSHVGTMGALWMSLHNMLHVIERIFPWFIARSVEEWLMDSYAEHRTTGDVVVFHPEFAFPKTMRAAKKRGAITIALATMADIEYSAELEKTEQELLKIPNTDRYYQDLAKKTSFINDFDYVIALSDFVRDSYVRKGFPAEKFFVAYSDIEIPNMRAQAPSGLGQPFRVICVTHVNLLKGIQHLVAAWNMVDIPNKELVLIGGWKKKPRPWYRALHDTTKDDPTIRVLGHLSRKQVLEYYHTASVFAFPSLSEGNPKVVMEAMAAGLPVITTVNAQSLVQHGKSGFVVPIRNPEGICEKLEFLFRHPEVIAQMGNEARRTIEAKKPFGEAVYELYESIKQKHNL